MSIGSGRLLAGISLIDISQFNALVRRILNSGHKTSHLGAIIPTGWCDMQGQQVPQRVKTACLHSATELLVDRRPRWKVIRHGAPDNSVENHGAQPIEPFAQCRRPLFRIFTHHGIRRDHSSSDISERYGLRAGVIPHYSTNHARKYITPSRAC